MYKPDYLSYIRHGHWSEHSWVLLLLYIITSEVLDPAIFTFQTAEISLSSTVNVSTTYKGRDAASRGIHPAQEPLLSWNTEFLITNQTMDAGKLQCSTGINKTQHFTVQYNKVVLQQMLVVQQNVSRWHRGGRLGLILYFQPAMSWLKPRACWCRCLDKLAPVW